MPAQQDSRLNLILTGNNQQLSQTLKATTADVSAMSAGFENSSKVATEATGNIYAKFVGVKEVFENILDVGRSNPAIAAFAHLFAVVTEGAEIFARTGIEAANFYDQLGEIPNVVQKNVDVLEKYIGTLENDPFIQAAARVETYELRLKSLSGSEKQAAETTKFMYAEAAKGGFKTENLLEAGVILRELNQDIEKTLPLAEKLAAGTGHDLPIAAAALGNAFAGLDTGFTQLQKTFHLTRDQLIQNGAATNEYGDIVNITTKDILKNQDAISKVVNRNYAHVVKEQASSIKGAFTGFHEEIERVFEMVGDSMKKPVVDFVLNVTSLVKRGQDIVKPFFEFVKETGLAVFAPINIGARIAAAGVDLLESSVEGAHKVFEALPVPIKAGVGYITTMTAVAGKLAYAFLPMAAATAGLFLTYKALGLVATGIASITTTGGMINGLATSFLGLQTSANATLKTLFVMPFYAAAIAGSLAALAAGFYAVYREQSKSDEMEKEYRETISKTINVAEKYRKIIGMTSKELTNQNISSNSAKVALEAMNASLEQSAIKVLDLAKAEEKYYASKALQGKTYGADPFADELANKKAFAEKSLAWEKAKYAESGKALQEYIAKRKEYENQNGLSGSALFEKATSLEERKVKFDRDRSRGVLADKQKEAGELDSIYREALKNRLAYDDQISALEESHSHTPDNKRQEQEIINQKSLRQKQSEIEKTSAQEVLVINQQAMETRLEKQREALSVEVQTGKKSSTDELNNTRKFIKEEEELSLKRLGSRVEVVKALAEAQKAGNEEQIEINKHRLAEIDDAEAVSAQFRLKLAQEVKVKAFQLAMEQRQIQIQIQATEKSGLEDRANQARDDEEHGKNRIANIQEELDIIKRSNEIEKQAIKDKLAIELQSKHDPQEQVLAKKNAAAAIAAINAKELLDEEHIEEKKKAAFAQEIENNKTLIESRKELLESATAGLENKYNHGENNAAAIEANKKALEIKEIDIRKSAEKAELLNNTDAKNVVGIQARAQADIDAIKKRYELEASSRAEANAVRTADRKVQIAEDAEKRISLDKLKYEAAVQTGKNDGAGAFQKEQEFADKLLETHLEDLAAIRDAVKAHGNSVETARAEVEFTRASEEAKINRAKERTAAAAKERVGNADLAQKEVAEQKAILESKIESGQAGLNVAEKERDAIVESLAAQEESIKARLAEQIASGDVADRARSQRDAQLQINQAIRDSEKALKDVNEKYKTGNSELDKETKKYQKILDALNKIKGKEEDDNDPDLKEPEEGGLFGNAIGGFSESVRKSNLERKKTESEARQKSISQTDAKSAQAQSEQEIEFHHDQAMSLKLKAEGKSQEEIRAAIFQSHKEVEGANKSAKDKLKATPGTPGVNGPDSTPGIVPGSGPGSGGPGGGIGGGDQVVSLLTRIAVAVEKSSGVMTQPQAKPPMANNGQGSFADPNPTDFVGKIMSDLSISDSFKNDSFKLPGLGI
jgi:hypothetical protein